MVVVLRGSCRLCFARDDSLQCLPLIADWKRARGLARRSYPTFSQSTQPFGLTDVLLISESMTVIAAEGINGSLQNQTNHQTISA